MSEKTKQPKKVVLLDLDGTLTKSDPGIIGCVVKVFEELGYPVPDDEELQRFIGPAIVESLQRNNIPDDLLDEGIAIYRRYYAQEAVLFGNFNSFLFSMAGGMLSLLVMVILKKSGHFSIVGVSVAGGVFHNVGQITAAVFLMDTTAM